MKNNYLNKINWYAQEMLELNLSLLQGRTTDGLEYWALCIANGANDYEMSLRALRLRFLYPEEFGQIKVVADAQGSLMLIQKVPGQKETGHEVSGQEVSRQDFAIDNLDFWIQHARKMVFAGV